jgi:hypothetical protein
MYAKALSGSFARARAVSSAMNATMIAEPS